MATEQGRGGGRAGRAVLRGAAGGFVLYIVATGSPAMQQHPPANQPASCLPACLLPGFWLLTFFWFWFGSVSQSTKKKIGAATFYFLFFGFGFVWFLFVLFFVWFGLVIW